MLDWNGTDWKITVWTMRWTFLSYITDEAREVLCKLLAFSSVKEWKKKLKGVLKEFTFMNLLIYGRDKSFDMQSLKAFKSLKAYKFFYDAFVKNVWVHEFVKDAVFPCICTPFINL